MPIQKLNRSIIEAAILGFEFQKKDLDIKIAELKTMLDGGSAATTAMPEATIGKRKKFSAASRRKMALAQKARWAKIKGESEPAVPATPKAKKAKRKLSAEGRANIVKALKKRWAAKKKAAKKTATTAA